MRITVKAAGGHSRELARLRPGTKVLAGGPYGALTAARRRRAKVLLLAGGVGVTPLRALFETLPAAPGDLTLLYYAHAPEDLALRTELDAIARERGARVHCSVSTPEGFRLPLTAAALSAAVPGLSDHDVYLCGPPGMADAAESALREAGIARRNIHRESFDL
jgi:ferredoxin-NADP reductase